MGRPPGSCGAAWLVGEPCCHVLRRLAVWLGRGLAARGPAREYAAAAAHVPARGSASLSRAGMAGPRWRGAGLSSPDLRLSQPQLPPVCARARLGARRCGSARARAGSGRLRSSSRQPPGAWRPVSWRGKTIRTDWHAEDGQPGPRHAVANAGHRLTRQQAAAVTARDSRRGSPPLNTTQIDDYLRGPGRRRGAAARGQIILIGAAGGAARWCWPATRCCRFAELAGHRRAGALPRAAPRRPVVVRSASPGADAVPRDVPASRRRSRSSRRGPQAAASSSG